MIDFDGVALGHYNHVMSFQRKRVVITGIGVVSPIGIGKEKYWQAIQSGRSGIKPITLFKTDGYNVKTAGEISDFNGEDYFPARTFINLDRAARLLLTASKLALEDTRYAISEENTHDIGVSVGTTFAALQCSSQFDQEALTEGPRLANPSLFPNTVTNAAASRISIHFKIKGLNATISTGMCASLDAIDYGVKAIQFHNKKMIAAGGAEDLSEQLFLGFYKANRLAEFKSGGDISCPFDARRNGFVLAEGAGITILEDLESARSRKTKIYGEILSVASTYSQTSNGTDHQRPSAMAETMTLALTRAGLKPSNVDYICASANSAAADDAVTEAQAIKEVFDESASKISVISIKSLIGESFSAGGILALIAAVGAMQNNSLIKTTLINAFCISGFNTSLVFKRFSE